MSRPFAFAVKARVAMRHKKDRPGTVERQTRHTNGSPRYVVRWDNDPYGTVLVWEVDLVAVVEQKQAVGR